MSIVSIVLQSFLALIFLIAGIGKVFGNNMHIENFKNWRLPQCFRVVTGIVEIVGVGALVVGYWEPSWTAAGALLLGVTAIGGIVTHLRAKDSFKQLSTILILGIIAFALFYLNISDFSQFPGFNG